MGLSMGVLRQQSSVGIELLSTKQARTMPFSTHLSSASMLAPPSSRARAVSRALARNTCCLHHCIESRASRLTGMDSVSQSRS